MSDLRIRGLTVAYQGRAVVRGVDLDAPAGAVTGIVGPHGAGKSTLLKTCVGLVAPQRGTITVGGAPAHGMRARIAYLPQRPEIDWDFPAQVRDVVAMGRYPHRRPLRRLDRADRQAIERGLARVGLSSFASRPIGELSGGQQQRVVFARALAQEARVMLLDEPLAGVDALTVSLLCDVLRDIAADGATVLLVNHDLRMLPVMCDRVTLLSRRVVADGPVDAVLTDEAVAATYGLHTSPPTERGGERVP